MQLNPSYNRIIKDVDFLTLWLLYGFLNLFTGKDVRMY